MDDVRHLLAKRRQYLATQSRLTLDQTTCCSSIMSEYNSKVDLRPQWAINDNTAKSGKPHVDAVLQPSQREVGIPRSIPRLSPDQLTSVKLRKTGIRNSIDAEGRRTVNDTENDSLKIKSSPNVKVNVFNYRVDSESSKTNLTAMAPPTPPPLPLKFKVKDDFKVQDKDDADHRFQNEPKADNVSKDAEITWLKAQMDELKANWTSTNNNNISVKPQANSGELPMNSRQQDFVLMNERNVEPRFDKSFDIYKQFNDNERNMPEGMRKWIDQLVNDKFERISRLDAYEHSPPKLFDQPKRLDRSRSKDSKYRKDGMKTIDNSFQPKNASRSSRAPSVSSFRSTAKSIKSVLFKRTEEEEILSDVENDDIADINAGATGFIDYTSEKFTIHGPFVDKELNVFHAICVEYQLAARISFAKRTAFSRTNPAHIRVYVLLGSNRRSSWTNRDSWPKATNDLQILDFIFRRIIRS
jgi:hypothetical protein